MQQRDYSESAAKNWLSDTRDARRQARQALIEMPASIPSRVTVHPPEIVRLAHNAVLDYYSHLQVKSGVTNGKWERELCTVDLPQDGRVDAGRTDEYGRIDVAEPVQHVGWQSVDVSLNNLATLFDEDNQVRIEIYADGELFDIERATYYMPPLVTKTAFRHLDTILEDLGWVPDAATADRAAENNEVLTHE
jgi:hypothetical protein